MTARSRAFEWTLLGLAAALALFLLAQLYDFGPGVDQDGYRLIADGLAHGAAPYRNRWDMKPPGIFFLYALGQLLCGAGAHGMRVFEILGALAMAAGLCALSRRHLGEWRAGILCAALALLNLVQLEFWHTGQPETFGGMLLVGALLGATAQSTGTRLVAGILFGAAGLLKPPLGGGLVVSAFLIARRERRAGPVLAMVAGAALPVAATLLYFAQKGALGDLYDAMFVFAPGFMHVTAGRESLGALLGKTVWLAPIAPAILLGVVAWLALPPIAPREREAGWHVLGAVAPQLAGVTLQSKFFAYHYGGTLPLLALLAGWGLWKLALRLKAPLARVAGVVGFALLIFLVPPVTDRLALFHPFWMRCGMRLEALLDPAARPALHDRLYSQAGYFAPALRAVGQWVREHTAPDDKLFVWGYQTGLYLSSERAPASRYVLNLPQRSSWSQQRSRRLLLEDLARTAPAVIVVQHDDLWPYVDGPPRDSAAELAGFPELAQLIAERYRPAARVNNFDLYAVNPAPPR